METKNIPSDVGVISASAIIVGPEGSNADFENGVPKLNASGMVDKPVAMQIQTMDKKGLDKLKNPFQPMEKPDEKCATTVESVVINGITAQKRSDECESTVPDFPKTKSVDYTFATKDDSIINLLFMGESGSVFDKYLSQFEDSVKTVKISNPADIQSSPLFQELEKLRVQDNQTTGG